MRDLKSFGRSHNRLELLIMEVDVHFVFSKEDLRKAEDHVSNILILYDDCDGIDKKRRSNWKFLDEEDEEVQRELRELCNENLKSNFYKARKNFRFSVFLIDNDRFNLIREKNCILVGNKEEGLQVLDNLTYKNNEEIYGEKQITEISNWKDYIPKLPMTDAIICDNYYFKDKFVYEKNNNELIEAIASVPHNSPINIVLIVKAGNEAIDHRINIEKEQKEIERKVRSMSGSKDSHFFILSTYKEHGRRIITNYYRIKHDGTFNIKDAGLKEDVMIEIKPLSAKKEMQASIKHLKICKSIADSPTERYPKEIKVNKITNLFDLIDLYGEDGNGA